MAYLDGLRQYPIIPEPNGIVFNAPHARIAAPYVYKRMDTSTKISATGFIALQSTISGVYVEMGNAGGTQANRSLTMELYQADNDWLPTGTAIASAVLTNFSNTYSGTLAMSATVATGGRYVFVARNTAVAPGTEWLEPRHAVSIRIPVGSQYTFRWNNGTIWEPFIGCGACFHPVYAGNYRQLPPCSVGHLGGSTSINAAPGYFRVGNEYRLPMPCWFIGFLGLEYNITGTPSDQMFGVEVFSGTTRLAYRTGAFVLSMQNTNRTIGIPLLLDQPLLLPEGDYIVAMRHETGTFDGSNFYAPNRDGNASGYEVGLYKRGVISQSPTEAPSWTTTQWHAIYPLIIPAGSQTARTLNLGGGFTL